MHPSLRRILSGIALAHLLILTAAGVETPRYTGRPVVEVLGALRDNGLEFVYSSDLVPPTLIVSAEPRAREPLLVALEILAAQGLTLAPVRPGLFAVVIAPPAGARHGTELQAPFARPAPLRAALAEIVVSTSRYALDQAASGSLRIGGDLLAAQAVLGEDAIRAAGRLPGMTQDGVSARSIVRGGEFGEVLTLLDGFPLRQAFHLPGYQSVFGVIDPGLIAEAEVFTGGFPVRYGNRMAGVFDLHTIDATDAPQTALGLSVFNAMARSSGRLTSRNADGLAAVRVGTVKPFIHAFAHDAGEPTYADAYARIGYGEPAALRLTANFLWSHDELAIKREGRDDSAQFKSHSRYLWLRADRDWGGVAHGSLWLGHSQIHAFRSGAVDDADYMRAAVSDRRSSDYWELRGRFDRNAGDRHWLEGGFEWTREDARYSYAADASYPAAVAALFARPTTLARVATLVPDRERVAVFAAHRWQIGRDIVSELGLRATRTVTAGDTTENWLGDPRLSLRWQIAPATSLRAHWGRFRQTDEVHELKVEDGLTSFPEAQRSDHLIAGLDHEFADGLAMRLEWFRKLQSDPRAHFENLLDPLSVTPEVAPDRVMIAPDSAEIRGVEISLVARSPQFDWWASASWSKAMDTIDGRRTPRSWDQTWAATAGVDWRRGDWRYGVLAVAHRGWPTTRVLATTLGTRNAARFPPRIGIDLRAEYRKSLATGQLAFNFELTNAVNVGNACCQELVSTDDGSGGTLFSARRSDWLPLVPSLGVLWEF